MNLVERTLELIRIPSVTGDEGAICDFLAAQLGTLPDHELRRIGDNLLLWPKTRQRPLVALFGHLDTVPPKDDNPARCQGDLIYGLGSSDMKGGVALIWQLLAEPVSDPAYDLACVFYAAEEGPYETSGLKEVIAQCPQLAEIDLALLLEPSDNVLQLGCLGSLHAEVTFEGRSAHSARPWQGQNAIHAAAPFLTRLAAMQVEQVSFGELSYREVISVTLANGGTTRNVVPDRFVLNVNYRFAPGQSLAQACSRIEALVGKAAKVRFVDEAPAGAIPRNNALVDDFKARCQTAIGPKQAWTDVARLSDAGIAAVNFGPGQSDQCHQEGEHASASMLLQGEQLLRRFLSKG